MSKRSFMHGLFAGVVVKLACTAAFAAVLLVLARLQGHDPHWMPLSEDGRLQPWSTGWVIAQVFVVAGAFLSGLACARWSKAEAWAAPLTLAGIWFAWSVFRLPEGWPMRWATYMVVVSPASILLGALVQRSWQRRGVGHAKRPGSSTTRDAR